MVGRAAHGSCQGVHSEGPVGGRGPGLPVGEEALALLVCVKLVAGMGDACEGEHGRGSKPAEFGEGNGAEGVATRRSCGSVAGVKATGKLAVKLVGAVDKAGRSGGACASLQVVLALLQDVLVLAAAGGVLPRNPAHRGCCRQARRRRFYYS